MSATPPHRIPQNHGTRTPQLHVVVHATAQVRERAPGRGELRLVQGRAEVRNPAAKRTRRAVHEFARPDEFWSWLRDVGGPGSSPVVWSADWGVLASLLDMERQLAAWGWVTTTYIGGDPPFFVRCKRPGKGLRICDIRNVSPWSLEQDSLAPGTGLIHSTSGAPADGDSSDILEHICDSLWGAVARALERVHEWDLGAWSPTIAGQSLASWRHRLGDTHVESHRVRAVLDLEREAMRPGRVQAWPRRSGPGEWVQIDVRAMYPSLMVHLDYPALLRAWGDAMELSRLRRLLTKFCLIAEVDLAPHAPEVGMRLGSGISWSGGEGKAVLTSRELALCLEHDAIRAVRRWAAYDKGPIFRTWADDVLRWRSQAEEAGDSEGVRAAKLLGASLWGKLGQRTPEWKDEDYGGMIPGRTWADVDLEHGTVTRWRLRHGITQRMVARQPAVHSLTAASAHIVADGHLAMRTLLQEIGLDRVVLVQTDGVLADLPGGCAPDSFEWEGVEFALREEWRGDSVRVVSPYDVTRGERRVVGGVRRDARWLDRSHWEAWSVRCYDAHLERDEHAAAAVSLMSGGDNGTERATGRPGNRDASPEPRSAAQLRIWGIDPAWDDGGG